MSRFVVLAHNHPEPHFDFMLEAEGELLTWRLSVWPPDLSAAQPEVSLQATPLPPHRLAYLEYEGPVSDNRGVVRRVEAGTFDWVNRASDFREIFLYRESGTCHVQIERRPTLDNLIIRSLPNLTAPQDAPRHSKRE
jgi:hypothetical protein